MASEINIVLFVCFPYVYPNHVCAALEISSHYLTAATEPAKEIETIVAL